MPYPGTSALENVLGNSQEVTDLFGTMRQDQEEQPLRIGSDMDPKTGQVKYKVEATPEVMATVMKALDFQARAVTGMQQHADFLAQQEAKARANPLLNALSTVAGNLAVTDPRLPPLVSALGRSSLQLNPTANQLAQERVALENEIARTSGAVASHLETSQYHSDVLAETQRYHREQIEKGYLDKFQQEARLAAKAAGGPLSKEAFTSLAHTRRITSPELIDDAYAAHVAEAAAYTKGAEAAVERKKGYATFKESLDEQLAGVKGKISLRNRIAAINTAFQNSVSQTEMDFQTKLYEHKKAIDAATAQNKEFMVLGNQAGQQLKSASATNGYLDTVEHMLEQPEFKQVQGPLFQFNPATGEVKFNEQAALPKSFKNIDRTVVESQISHEIPRLLGLLLNGQAGGASILRTDVGKKLVQDMGITGAIRPDQALAVLKIIRDTNNNNIAATMRLKPKANYAAIKDLIGADDPRNAYFFKGKKDSFGGPVVPFPSPYQGGDSKSKETDPLGVR